MDQLLQNIQEIKLRIDKAARASGRSSDDIILVAVSKTVGLDEVEHAIEHGLDDFGENRSRELARKQERFPQARWHMIGQLQTNKVKEVVGKTSLIHSVDRWSLAEALEREAARQRLIVDVLVEVNVAGEEQKGGLELEKVKPFLQAASKLQHLRILGFMGMAPISDDPETSRPVFKALHNLFTAFQQNPPGGNVDMQYLSMGMSQDFEVAVEEGANIVRVGTAIFAK